MASVPSTRARWPMCENRVRSTAWTSLNPGAIGALRVALSLVNRRRGRQKGGHLDECPDAGVRVTGD